MPIQLPFTCPMCGKEITSDDVISDQKKTGIVHKVHCSKCNYSKVFSVDTK